MEVRLTMLPNLGLHDVDRVSPSKREAARTRVRAARPEDVPILERLNHEAYPDLVEEGVVFDARQLALHQERFAEGQVVAELAAPARDLPAGAVVGALATLIVPGERALAPHTWYAITDDGTFSTHDPTGDTLYLADVYVGKAAWGLGVGPSLYDALFATCARLGLARVVAGGRMWSYFAYAAELTPEEYVRDVVDGRIKDRVLQGQLAAGFRVTGILPNYLQDARSGGYATFLEWSPPSRGSRD